MFATKDDVEGAFRPLTSVEAGVVPNWISYLEAQLAYRAPGIVERFQQGDQIFKDLVTGTVCAAVIRVLKNPGGLRQVSVDDGGYTLDAAISSGLLRFESDELALLQPRVALGGAYVVGLGG